MRDSTHNLSGPKYFPNKDLLGLIGAGFSLRFPVRSKVVSPTFMGVEEKRTFDWTSNVQKRNRRLLVGWEHERWRERASPAVTWARNNLTENL
ncbi:hypothetical protein OUZ56_021380 [Daphnia magna]|uniref:Uncharacterized protein n=1 Tax=Daphnia magna TaxID=35525 RepID=A0ABQ9ZIM6_9CRUS|nr:hypothetical protein OUZ56_021380 [Daphnia magna]